MDERLAMVDAAADAGNTIRWFFPGQALRIGVVAGASRGKQVYLGEDGVQVFLDGYLYAPVDRGVPGQSVDQPAAFIADLYRKQESAFLLALRGSYTCVLYDSRRERGWLFNDRLGSRPMYLAETSDGALLAAPRVSDLANLLGGAASINRQGIAEFLVSGSFYADHTFFEPIKLFPQAGLLELGVRTGEPSRYWSLRFSAPDTPVDEANLVDECDTLLEQAIRRSLEVTRNPVLAMSGGIDSRVLLGYLQRAGLRNIPLATYGIGAHGQNDVSVSRQIAGALGLKLVEYLIDLPSIDRFATEAMWRVDGRADVLDAASLLEFWSELGNDFDAMFQGDQCFGWHGDAATPIEALELFHRCNLDVAPRLSSWIDPAVRRQISAGIAETQQQMLAATGQSAPNDIKDVLFFEQAVGNIQNAYASSRRNNLEQIRPLLDEDVLEFISRLPESYRFDKYLLRAVLKRHPVLSDIPVADKHALPRPVDYLAPASSAGCGALHLFREVLLEGLHNGLGDWIDPVPVIAVVDSLARGAPLPPVAASWWRRLPLLGRAGYQRQARSTHPFIIVRRLVAANLYLKSVQPE